MQIYPWHGPEIEDARGRSAMANGRGNLRCRPGAQAGGRVGREIAADKDAMRIGADAHPVGQIRVVGTIDPGGVELGMAQSASLWPHTVHSAVEKLTL